VAARLTDLLQVGPPLFAEYAGAVRAAYGHAVQDAKRIHNRLFHLADATVRVCGPDETLVELMTEALAHRQAPLPAGPGPAADLTVHLWGGAGAPRAAPPSPLGWYNRHRPGGPPAAPEAVLFDGRGELPAFNTPRLRTSFQLWPPMLHVLDLDRGEAFCWIGRADRVPYYETAAPFYIILSWWASARGWLFAHAGAVGTAAGGVLLVGPGGAGKSTSALACIGSPLGYAADDYCLVNGGAEPRVSSLYSSAKLVGAVDLERFPRLAPLVRNAARPADEKALLFLQRDYPGRLINGFPLRALVVPRVLGGRGARLVPTTPAAALAAMAPSTCIQLPGSGRGALTLMAGLVRRLPAFTLEFGPDLPAVPAALGDLLTACGSPGGAG
jgi:hypothetical protein